MRWFPGFACLCAVCISSLACQFLPASSAEPSAEPPVEIQFQDNFSDPESGWRRAKTLAGAVGYEDGAYRILVNRRHTDIWSLPGRSFDNISVEVQAIKVGGSNDNRFGLICRAVDESNFYTFWISSDGYYGIGKMKDQSFSLIGQPALQPSSLIEPGLAFNHLRADCIGDTLSLYINDQPVVQVNDSEFAVGDVGLIAGAYETPGTDIRFTDFKVLSR